MLMRADAVRYYARLSGLYTERLGMVREWTRHGGRKTALAVPHRLDPTPFFLEGLRRTLERMRSSEEMHLPPVAPPQPSAAGPTGSEGSGLRSSVPTLPSLNTAPNVAAYATPPPRKVGVASQPPATGPGHTAFERRQFSPGRTPRSSRLDAPAVVASDGFFRVKPFSVPVPGSTGVGGGMQPPGGMLMERLHQEGGGDPRSGLEPEGEGSACLPHPPPGPRSTKRSGRRIRIPSQTIL